MAGRPIVIINFKTYPEGTGKKAVALAKLCEAAGKQYKMDVRVAVQATDIATVAAAVKSPVYAQHVDGALPGKTTGWLTAHAVAAAGAKGVLLNHSEHPRSDREIAASLAQCKKAGLTTVVLAHSTARLRGLQRFRPNFFGIEPPELIASETSVSEGRPTVISTSVKLAKVPLLVGAGVKTFADIDVARKMGAPGVVLSSHILLAKDQRAALKTLMKG